MKIPENLGEARAIQEAVAIEAAGAPPITPDRVRLVGGADAAYSLDGRTIHAAVAVLGLPDLDLREWSTFSCEARFPYRPGYFFFREGPAIMGAATGLGKRPDLLLVNGHGLAHPRRAGIAVHVGLLLGIPTIGVANRILCGKAGIPGPARGSASPIVDDGEVVGMAVTTRAGCKPLFVSPGYATDQKTSVGVVLSATGGFRIPAPLRDAHRISRQVLQGVRISRGRI